MGDPSDGSQRDDVRHRTDVFLKANEGNHGADGEIIGSALSIVRVGCQWIGTAVGAALIGAAVVIQVLAPRESETEEDLDSTDP